MNEPDMQPAHLRPGTRTRTKGVCFFTTANSRKNQDEDAKKKEAGVFKMTQTNQKCPCESADFTGALTKHVKAHKQIDFLYNIRAITTFSVGMEMLLQS